jgi:hypothetical protein
VRLLEQYVAANLHTRVERSPNGAHLRTRIAAKYRSFPSHSELWTSHVLPANGATEAIARM